MACARGRAHRQRRILGLVVGRLQDVPALAELRREWQFMAHRGLGVVGEQDQRVIGEEAVEATGRLDELREGRVGALDRVDGRRRPVAVRVGVVVGQREEQEVVEAGRRQLRGAARRILVAAAGDRRRLAGNRPARVELAVEELRRPPGRVAELEPGCFDRPAQQTVERDLVAVAPAVDQKRGAGGAQTGVVEALEDRLDVRAQVREVHVVDEVIEGAEDPEGPRCLQGRPVLDVASLEPVVPVHAADPVLLGAGSCRDLGAGDGRHRREARDALLDENAAVEELLERRRAAVLDCAAEHVGAQGVDVGEDELAAHGDAAWRRRLTSGFAGPRACAARGDGAPMRGGAGRRVE